MSFALAASAPFMCDWADDRSLGGEGLALRESLAVALAPPAEDRGDDIYLRVAEALQKAERQDGVLIIPETFGRALDVLEHLPREIPLPEVVVESATEIGMDWDEGSRRVLSLTVTDTPFVGYSGLFGMEPVHGRVVFADEVPQTLRFFFGKLYPAARER
jgi:hypothetical protein